MVANRNEKVVEIQFFPFGYVLYSLFERLGGHVKGKGRAVLSAIVKVMEKSPSQKFFRTKIYIINFLY